MSLQRKTYLPALGAVLCWSTVATAFKIGLENSSPLHLILIASFVSWLIFFMLIIIRKQTSELWKTSWKELSQSALLGAFNPFIYYLVLFKAYSLLPAQVAQSLNMMWPIMLALLSVPLLKHKISWKQAAAILISFFGVVLISSRGGISGFHHSNPWGIFLALFSSIIWSLYWIFNVRDKRPEPLKLFWSFLFGFIYLLIAAFLTSDYHIHFDRSFAAATYIGFFELGIAYILWMKAVQSSDNNAKIGTITYISPFVSLVFIHFILNETIYSTTIPGLILIVTGILLQQMKPKRPSFLRKRS